MDVSGAPIIDIVLPTYRMEPEEQDAVRDWLVGQTVDGCCYRRDGSPDFIMGQRKRAAKRRSPAGQTSCPNASDEPRRP